MHRTGPRSSIDCAIGRSPSHRKERRPLGGEHQDSIKVSIKVGIKVAITSSVKRLDLAERFSVMGTVSGSPIPMFVASPAAPAAVSCAHHRVSISYRGIPCVACSCRPWRGSPVGDVFELPWILETVGRARSSVAQGVHSAATPLSLSCQVLRSCGSGRKISVASSLTSLCSETSPKRPPTAQNRGAAKKIWQNLDFYSAKRTGHGLWSWSFTANSLPPDGNALLSEDFVQQPEQIVVERVERKHILQDGVDRVAREPRHVPGNVDQLSGGIWIGNKSIFKQLSQIKKGSRQSPNCCRRYVARIGPEQTDLRSLVQDANAGHHLAGCSRCCTKLESRTNLVRVLDLVAGKYVAHLREKVIAQERIPRPVGKSDHPELIVDLEDRP